ncbi:hypothetical protein MHZ95_07290 [Sporosarcina sp. ACRSM]|uniref:hypothetical protein n=1 Tax=Sporosarcina sp. ACRSM TaxID=2918216 RepID=UPI001EF56CE4|nr:hypothetical protein [Sporosarcina sp. ACRSM]MCG7335078.1 hypothetical protein [Sporosarcina sp. ACRSM]
MKSNGMLKFVISIFSVLLLLAGCSSKPSVDLVGSTVEIRSDEARSGGIGITSGEKKGEIIVPVALSYEFVLKNTGKKNLGEAKKINELNFVFDDGIKVRIEPHEKLKAISEEVMGINIYNEEENLGMGLSSMPVLEPNQEGKYTFDYTLGALEENPEIRLAPSPEQLEKLKEHAMDAILIVTVEDEEIARFDLSHSE